MLDRRRVRARERVQVQRDYCDPVGELFCNRSERARHVSEISKIQQTKVRTNIFARRVQRIEVVQVGKRAEKLAGPAHLVSNDETAFPATFDLEYLDNRAVALLDVPHHLLVDLERVFARFLQKRGVGDRVYISLPRNDMYGSKGARRDV